MKSCERGEGMVAALLLLAGALLPLCFLVALLGRLEQARLAADQAASAAVRAAALAPTLQAGQEAAATELAAAQLDSTAPLELRLQGDFGRGGELEAEVSARVAIGSLPFLGSFGTLTLRANAQAPVDSYRSFAGPS